jgi:hypothetical protein
MGRLACIAALIVMATAGVAAAAPPWSPPQNVSSPSLFVESPDVVVAPDGRTIAIWRWRGAQVPGASAPSGTRLAVREPGSAGFGPERAAPKFVTPLVAYARERLLGLDTKQRSRGRVSLRARFGVSRGGFARARTISTYEPAGGPPSLAPPSGGVAAWIAKGSGGRRIVRAAAKGRGGFLPAVTLRGKGRANDVVAGAALGVMWVAWERAGMVEARVMLAGRRWSPLQRLGRATRASTTFATVGSGRRGYLAWLAQEPQDAFIRTAVLPVARDRFRKAEPMTLCPPSESCADETILSAAPAEGQVLRLVPLSDRDALLAWSRKFIHPDVWSVRMALTDGRTTFSPRFDVTPLTESAVLSDVASRPDNDSVMFVWSRLDAVGELGDRIRARTWTLQGGFSAPEDVSDLDRARIPAVAYDSHANRWATVWSQRIGPDAPGVPLPQITTFARSSTRPG